jgi:hypothetical protein
MILEDSKNLREGLATGSLVFEEGLTTESVNLREYSRTTLAWRIQLLIFFQDSKNLREALA